MAARFPAAVAVVDRTGPVSFAELTDIVGGLAAQIAEAPAPPGPVALLQSVGVDAVAAWFACALAGRPFLLLEAENPPERNCMLMERAGARLLLSDFALDPIYADRHLLSLRPDGRRARIKPDQGIAAVAPSMIFPTSGSTGDAKLITYAARTLQIKVQASISLMGVQVGDCVLIAGSPGNYGFLHHALVFMLSGGALFLADIREGGLTAIFSAILEHGVRHVRFTPSLFRAAAAHPSGQAAFAALKGVRFSGEPLLAADLNLAHRVLDLGCRIQNVYGSTESSLFIWTDNRSVAVPPGTVPIGKIYPLSEFRIEDGDGLSVPQGDLGELVISSVGHALGDCHLGQLDGSRFPPDLRGGGLRIYRTGDIVRMEADGQLSVAGRHDRLVKINGQRVSLDEIESHLQAMPGVAQAAVMERPGASGNRLVAFVVATAGASSGDEPGVRLARRLPRYMVPARFVWRNVMPLLPGGKVDRKALLASLPPDDIAHAEVANGDPIEDLAAIWGRILKLPHFAPDTDFFSLGGDSLLMMELQLAVEARFCKGFPRENFITNPTLRRLVGLLGLAPNAAPRLLERGKVEISFRLVRGANGTAQGVAICMPGLGGSAAAERIANSPLLAAHDLWACDARLRRGTIVQHGQYLEAAVAVATAISSGEGPKADVLIGYSVGGYISWLVARLLDNGPCAPAHVITIDTRPLHWMRRYRGSRLADLLL
ncbi:MAG: non-ribosomal peptide synthetase, partial [Paracoccaceae bacterium]